MELGFVGLGRMGGAMVTRLARGGHRIIAWDPSADAVKRSRDNGADAAASLLQRAKALKPPRAVWVMVPVPTITASLFARFRSRRDNSFADRLLAALRNEFGGHAVHR